jgi:hypothetical protein
MWTLSRSLFYCVYKFLYDKPFLRKTKKLIWASSEADFPKLNSPNFHFRHLMENWIHICPIVYETTYEGWQIRPPHYAFRLWTSCKELIRLNLIKSHLQIGKFPSWWTRQSIVLHATHVLVNNVHPSSVTLKGRRLNLVPAMYYLI